MTASFKYTAKGWISRLAREGWAFRRLIGKLNESQWYSPEALAMLQNRRLQAMVRYAARQVPYYRELFNTGNVSWKEIQSISDLSRIPVLEKDDLLKGGERFLPRGMRKYLLLKARISGTTGKPLTVYRDYHSVNFERANVHRLWKQAGYRFGDPFVTIRGEAICETHGSRKRYWAMNHIHNELVMSSFHLSGKTMADYWDRIISFNPSYIYCYPQSLLTLLNYAEETDYPLHSLAVKGVFTSSETVAPFLRKRVKKLLGCPIVDYYNTAERVVPIASCEYGNYHVLEDCGIAEFFPVDPERHLYEIVGTGLTNRGMPLFRYRTRDIVEYIQDVPPCPCGRHFRQVKQIIGRPAEHIIGAHGRLISGAGLTHIFYGKDTQVIETQVIQQDEKQIRLRIVPSDFFSEQHKAVLSDAFEKYTGIVPDIEVVSSIERTDSGKFRFILKPSDKDMPKNHE